MAEIRFLLDEHISTVVARRLREKGIEACTLQEIQRGGLPDLEQLRYSNEEGWVLVTKDSDFLRLAGQCCPHAGIVFVSGRMAISALIETLVALYLAKSRDDFRDFVYFS
ncbi:MAG: DUF5615 family PIN-like protein [Candidatus Omnitrophica bacterium]|nr:DUF5615 family PIN-like protein [Candidatus Omnitrophota bacterium]